MLNIFPWACLPSVGSLRGDASSCLLPIFSLHCLFFHGWVWKVLYMFRILVLFWTCGLQIFFQSKACIFTLLTDFFFFWQSNSYILMKSIYQFFLLWTMLLVSSLRTLYLTLDPQIFLYFLKKLLKCSWFSMLCQFLLYSKVTQSYIYIHSFPHIIFHHVLSQEIGYSFLCCTLGPHCLSILNGILIY